MDLILGIVVGAIVVGFGLVAVFEYRVRQPDVLVLHETKDGIGIRKGPVYPRDRKSVV